MFPRTFFLDMLFRNWFTSLNATCDLGFPPWVLIPPVTIPARLHLRAGKRNPPDWAACNQLNLESPILLLNFTWLSTNYVWRSWGRRRRRAEGGGGLPRRRRRSDNCHSLEKKSVHACALPPGGPTYLPTYLPTRHSNIACIYIFSRSLRNHAKVFSSAHRVPTSNDDDD